MRCGKRGGIILTSIFVLYVVLAILQAYAQEKGKNHAAGVLKIFLMPVLCAGFLTSGHAGGPAGFFFALALFFDWCGDILLLFKRMEILTLGAGSFLIGHLLRIIVFLLKTDFPVPVLPFVLLAAVYTAIVIRVCPIFGHRLGRKKYTDGIRLYGTMLAAMSLAALLLMESALRVGNAAGLSVFAGSLLFIVSDIRLIDTFTKRQKPSGVMETYTLAQLLMVLGTAGI